MKRILLLAIFALGLWTTQANAQIINTTISGIQTVSPQDLAACIDTPRFVTKKVKVRGVVINRGGIAQTQSVGNRQVWIRAASAYGGPFTAIGMRATANQQNVGVDMLNLEEGDSITVVGNVGEFMGSQDAETQINVSPTDTITLEGSVAKPQPVLVNLGDLQGTTRINNLPTGEQYEGEFILLRNVTVTEVGPFTSGGENRVSFWVRDQAGNQMNVTDRFAAQRPRLGFIAPSVGDVFDSLMGIVIHSRNGCPGSLPNNRGYQIAPFDSSHYVFGPSAPGIFAVTRNPVCPRGTDAITVSATITNGYGAGGVRPSVSAVTLHYATGTGTGGYQTLAMTVGAGGGNTYSAIIPAQANGTFVRYYITATNSINLTNTLPNVTGTANPFFYSVNDNGCTIRDIQYTPYVTGSGSTANAESGYRGMIVEVEGVVVADTADNRAWNAAAASSPSSSITIQEEGALAWGGINVANSNNVVSTLRRGTKVRIRGTVGEFNQITQIQGTVTVTNNNLGTGNITPLVVSPSALAQYNGLTNEQYESMLVRVEKQGTTQITVIDTNFLITPVAGRNFGEWRVGYDQTSPQDGALILTGLATTTSRNVGYINSPRFASNLFVGPIIISYDSRWDYAQGIVSQTFGNLKLVPRDNGDFGNYTVGLASNVASAAFSVYPNPTTGTVNILSSSDVNGGTAILTDLAGRVVANQAVAGNSLNLTGVNAGLYLVRISDANGRNLGTHKLAVR